MCLAFPLASSKSPSKWQDSGPAVLSGHISFMSEKSGARVLQWVGGDLVFPTQQSSQERLLCCLIQLCSDTSCKHWGPGGDLTVSHFLSCFLCLNSVSGKPLGTMFQVPSFPWGLRESVCKGADREVWWPWVKTKASWTSLVAQ